MGWTGDITTETLMDEASEYFGDNSSITLDLMRKRDVAHALTHKLVTRNALLRLMSMAEWQHEEESGDMELKDWSATSEGKRGFEHPMAYSVVSLFNSAVLDKNGGEWAEPEGRGWNDADFMGQHPTEILLDMQLDSQAILMLLLPLKASEPTFYRRVQSHPLLSGQLSNSGSREECKNAKKNEKWDRPVVPPSPENSSEKMTPDYLSLCRSESSSLQHDFTLAESKSDELKSDSEGRGERRPDQGTQATTTRKIPNIGTELLPPSERERTAAILTAQAIVSCDPQNILLAVKILLCSFIGNKEGGSVSNYLEGTPQLPLGAIIGLLVDRSPLRDNNVFARFVQSAVCKVKSTLHACNAEVESSINLSPSAVYGSNSEFELDRDDYGVYASCGEARGGGGGVSGSALHELAHMSSRCRQLCQKQGSSISSLGSSSMALENSDIMEPTDSYGSIGVNPNSTLSGAGVEQSRDNKKSRSKFFSNAAACSAAAEVFRLREFFAFANEGEGNEPLELEDTFGVVDKLSIDEISSSIENTSSPVHSLHFAGDSDSEPSASLGFVSAESIVLALLADLDSWCHCCGDHPTAIGFTHPHSFSVTLLYSLLSQLLSMQKNLKLREDMVSHHLPTDVSGESNVYISSKTSRARYAHMLWRRRLFLATAMSSTLRVLDAILRQVIRHCPACSKLSTEEIVAGDLIRSLLENCVSFCDPNTTYSVDVAPAELRSLKDACLAKTRLSRSSALSAWASANSLACASHESRVIFVRRLLIEVMEEDVNTYTDDMPLLSSEVSAEPCAYLSAMCLHMSDSHHLEAFTQSLCTLIGLKHDDNGITTNPGIVSDSMPPKLLSYSSSASNRRISFESTFSEVTHHTEDHNSIPEEGGSTNSCTPFPTGGKGTLALMKVLLDYSFDFKLTPMLSSRPAALHLVLKLVHVLGDQIVKCGSYSGLNGNSGLCAIVLDLHLNASRKSDNVRISEDGFTATQTQSKVWGTVVTRQGCPPRSGVYQWYIHLRNCSKGNVILGVATAVASVNTYVGGDHYGWGLIGTRVLWHGRSKLRSNCGKGFSTNSVVLMSLDTDRGILMYTSRGNGIDGSSSHATSDQHQSNSNNGEWQVVVDDLPTNETLFPAISLYQLNDVVSISPVHPLSGSASGGRHASTSPLLSTCHRPSSLSMYDAYTSFLDFILDLVSRSQRLLSKIYQDLVEEKIDIESAFDRINVCPLLVYGLPSICASLLVARRLPNVAMLVAFKLLPYVTNLVGTFDKYLIFLGQEGTRHSLRANPHGTWHICSSTASDFSPAVEYTAEFYTHFNSQSGEYHLVGTSEGDSQKRPRTATVKGRVLGLHMAFMEQWKMEGTCVVESYLSLDGNVFWGTYRNVRSGVGGDITGHRIHNPDDEQKDATNLLLSFSVRTSSVVAMLAGYLACSLVLGVEAEPTELSPPMTEFKPDTHRMKSSVSSSDESLLSVPSQRHVEQIEAWKNSNLLNGGLKFKDVAPHVITALHSYFPSTTTSSDDNMSHWMLSLFPAKLISIVESGSGSATSFLSYVKLHDGSDDNSVPDVFVDDFLTGDGDYLALDAWESRRELNSPLVQLGGRFMLDTQRWVLAAIATHARLLPVSRKDFQRSRELVSKDEPSRVLIEVLRRARQVMESAVRHSQSTKSGYLPASNLLIFKSVFLLSVQPNQDALELSEVEDQDNSSEDGEGDVVTIISLCTSAGEFLQSPTFSYVEIKALYSGMVQSSFAAVFRAAGFSALKLLLNGNDGDQGEEIKQQPAPPIRVPFLASAAVQYLLPSLQGWVPMLVPQICSQYQSGLGYASTARKGCASLKDSRTHYLNRIIGANREATESVVMAFEGLYKVLAERLRTAATTRDGSALLALLPAWHLNFTSKDHEFLGSVGICKSLQLALECTRAETGPESEELLSSMWNSVKHSALHVIQFLVSCIALNGNRGNYVDERKEMCGGEVVSRREFEGVGAAAQEFSTFFKSLFNILLSELSASIQKMREDKSETQSSDAAIATNNSEYNSRLECSSLFLLSTEEMRGMLRSDLYCYFLLGLTHTLFVSFQSCTNCMYNQEWLNVLFHSVAVGPPAVQRRTLKILCELLPSTNPPIQLGCVETAFGSTESMEEFLLFCLGGNFVPISAIKLVREALRRSMSHLAATRRDDTSHLQWSVDDTVSNFSHAGHLHDGNSIMHQFIRGSISNPVVAEEIVALLRLLLKEPAWKDCISVKIMNAIDSCSELHLFGGEEPPQSSSSFYGEKRCDTQLSHIARAAAAASVLGGFVESLHLGSSVVLRRASQHRGMPEPLLAHIADSSRPVLLLTSFNIQSNTAQVVLPKCNGIGRGGGSPVQSGRDRNGKHIGLSNSVHATGDGGGVHVFKVFCDELSVVPLVEAQVDCNTPSSIAMAEKLFNALLNEALPWVIRERLLDVNDREESESSTVERSSSRQHLACSNFEVSVEIANQSGSGASSGADAGVGDSAAPNCDPDPTLASLELQEEEMFAAEQSALQSLLAVQIFKASATLLADPELSKVLLKSKPDLTALFEVAVGDAESGLLQQLVHHQELWLSAWDKWCSRVCRWAAALSMVSSRTTDGGTTVPTISAAERAPFSPVPPTVEVEADLENDVSVDSNSVNELSVEEIPRRQDSANDSSISLGSQNNLSSLASYVTGAAMVLGMGTVVMDTGTGAAQMVEMGFPEDWSRVALSRCGNSLEQAVAFCFENSASMDQIVASAEEQAEAATMQAPLASSSSRGEERAERIWGGHRRGGGLEALGLASPGSPSNNLESMLFTKQLLEMGFSRSQCERALSLNSSNVDSALTWILSNGEALAADGLDEERDSQGEKKLKSASDSTASAAIINPLQVISGIAQILPDLCAHGVPRHGFASIGARGCLLTSGKWYYETTVVTAGCMQVGWADASFQGNAESGDGVGDGPHSWAFDGCRGYKWHGESTPWGATWKAGDMVGCMVNFDECTLSFTLNGYGEEIGMGVAFDSFTCAGGLYPCASFNRDEGLKFNFGETPFIHSPPPGYQPYVELVRERISRYSNIMKGIHLFPRECSKEERRAEGSLPGNDQSIYVDCLEEETGIKGYACHAHYFAGDSGTRSRIGQGGAGCPYKFFDTAPTSPDALCDSSVLSVNDSGLLPLSEVEDMKADVKELASASRALCTLYARQASLMLFVNCSSDIRNAVIDGGNTEKGSRAVELVMKLLLISTAEASVETTTTEGAVVSDTNKAVLPSALLAGGARAQKALSCIVRDMLAADYVSSRHDDPPLLCSNLTACVADQIMKAGNRRYAHCSVYPVVTGGMGSMNELISSSRPSRKLFKSIRLNVSNTSQRPNLAGQRQMSVARNGGSVVPTTSGNVFSRPNLGVALWISSIILGEVLTNHHRGGGEKEENDTLIYTAVVDTFHSWSLSLISPNMTLKLLGSVVLSGILQGISSLALAISVQNRQLEALLGALSACLNHVPTDRLYSALLARLWAERMSTPMFSRYLQGLVEINASINIARIICKGKDFDDLDFDVSRNKVGWMYPPSIPKRLDPSFLPLQEPWNLYCREWDEGSTLSSEGWLLWSGHVIQRPVHWDRCCDRPPHCGRSTSGASGDTPPPPLVPGCFVVRREDWKESYIGKSPHLPHDDNTLTKDVDSESNGDLDDEGDEDSKGGVDTTNEGEEECSKTVTAVDVGNSSSSPPPPEDSPPPSCLLVGTVAEIVPLGGLAGGGRRIEWQDGSEGIYKWGAEGCIDLAHITFDTDGCIEHSFPSPQLPEDRASWSGFGSEPSWGVLLRMRPGPRLHNQNHSMNHSRSAIPFTGVLEWPDFSAAVAVEGEMSGDGSSLTFTEKELVYGNPHIGWEPRFATEGYISGTKYTITSTGCKNVPPSCLNGTSTGIAKLPGSCTNVICDVKLSDNYLFTFSGKDCSNSISVTSDGRLATCTGRDRCMVYGNVGFSWGVHYWEVKVLEGEPGCIFLGVAEKSEKLPPNQHVAGWQGMGFVNYRATYYNGIERVYGEHFNNGDTVGIRLDMDRGVLGFYLDGMKYGEHVTSDLGGAFEGLLGSSSRVSPRTLFPIVGFNNYGDRVALSTKWLSTPGCHPEMLLDNAMATVGLLQCCWKAEVESYPVLTAATSTSPPTCVQQLPRWFRVEAWQLWLRWRSGRWRRVRTRVQNGPQVDLDMSPRACAKASLLLGLGTLLFSGDVVQVMYSCGRPLEQAETCVVLGALRDKLYYRLENKKGDNASTSNGSPSAAWCWTPHDLPGMGAVTVLHRGDDVPNSVCALPVPRLRMHCGGWLYVSFEDGAAIRNGVTEQAIELGVIPFGIALCASSSYECPSGIRHFFVCHEGVHGWVCEKICGDVEVTVLRRYTCEEAMKTNHDLEGDDFAALTPEAEENVFEDVNEAVEEWVQMINELGSTAVKWLNMYDDPDDSLESFESASCQDNIWTLAEDFHIVRLLNEVSSCCATDPINVPFARLQSALFAVYDSSTHSSSARLYNSLERKIHFVIFGGKESNRSSSLERLAPSLVLARMAVLLALNLRIIHSLPFFSLSLPEKEWENNGNNAVEQPIGWEPVCMARKLRDLRRLLFTATKQAFWDSLIHASTTPTPLHHEEYEDPREVRLIKVNRIKAAPSRLCTIASPSERLRQSVFGQLHREMRGWPASTFRRAHVGKGHGGQRRAFKVKFLGEGVDDYGGPYRAVFEQVVDELQKDDLSLKPGQHVENGCLLPLLVPTPNRVAKVGLEQGKFLLAPGPVRDKSFSANVVEELASFLGKLLGVAVRHGIQMGLGLTPLVWNPLVDLPVGSELVQTVDHITHRTLRDVEAMGAALESGEINAIPQEWDHVTISGHLSTNHEVPLVPFGSNIPLSRENWKEYVQKLRHLRLTESNATLQAFRSGLAVVLPVEIFPLFTAEELERLFCGVEDIDVNLLRSCTEYDEGVTSSDRHVLAFWEVLEEMEPSERTAFLRFVWARSRMPSSAKDFPMWFKIQAPHGGAKDSPDEYLPSAQTCFFSLSLPFYSSKEVLHEKLLYAIAISPNMDADVRLSSTEGAWG